MAAIWLVNNSKTRQRKNHTNTGQAGLTLIEIMIVVAILAVTASIAIPVYNGFVSEARIDRAVLELRMIDLAVTDFRDTEGRYPTDLNEAGAGDMRDPWGRPYRYLDFTNVKGVGKMRKDKNLVPINSDFDLYSVGADGATATPFTSPKSHDDVVRANNGGFFGLAKDY